MRKTIVCLFLIIFPGFIQAKVDIPIRQRVHNKPPGVCAWACLETIGHYEHLSSLSGLVDWYAARTTEGATDEAIESQLEASHVRYELKQNADIAYVKQNTDAGIPVMVGVSHWKSGAGHAIIVVDVQGNMVYLIDPNQPEVDLEYSLDNFNSIWYHWTVVVYGKA